ncbi:MAG: metallophosphoesterase [Candidatus Thermoplasmatota archaeon]
MQKLVGLISDTHIPTRAKKIPEKVFEVFESVDLIIHGGDLIELSVINILEKLAPVIAAHGNMDPPNIRQKLPEINSTEVLGWKIGVIHNPYALWGLSRMRRIATSKNFDVLVFGHTHKPFIRQEKILFINPGSATDPIPPIFVKKSVGLLKITKEKIEPRIVRI